MHNSPNRLRSQGFRTGALEFHPTTTIEQCILDRCEIRSAVRPDNEIRVFDPAAIVRYVASEGFTLLADQPLVIVPDDASDPDERTILVQRALRLFLRNTHVNESAIRVRLGVKANEFVDDLLPLLLKAGVLEEVQYHGSGKQRRFRLCVPMQKVDKVLRDASGRFEDFINGITPAASAAGSRSARHLRRTPQQPVRSCGRRSLLLLPNLALTTFATPIIQFSLRGRTSDSRSCGMLTSYG